MNTENEMIVLIALIIAWLPLAVMAWAMAIEFVYDIFKKLK